MAELTTLARPYAKAAFEQARDDNELASWLKALSLGAAVAEDDTVGKLLSSPSLTAKDKGQRFADVCGDQLNDKQKNFVMVLAENQRLALLPQVKELFDLYKSNYEKAVDVEIYTAFETEHKKIEQLSTALTQKLKRKVSLRTQVDKSLIGGALIRAGDTVIDGSVRGRLNRLAEAMKA